MFSNIFKRLGIGTSTSRENRRPKRNRLSINRATAAVMEDLECRRLLSVTALISGPTHVTSTAPQTYALSATGGTPTYYFVNWNDAGSSPLPDIQEVPGTQKTVQHSFPSAGTYNVQAIATDGTTYAGSLDSSFASGTGTVHVQPGGRIGYLSLGVQTFTSGNTTTHDAIVVVDALDSTYEETPETYIERYFLDGPNAGKLDTSFGSGGTISISSGADPNTQFEPGTNSVVIVPSGSSLATNDILVAISATQSQNFGDLQVRCYQPNGQGLDTNFAGNGIFSYAPTNQHYAVAGYPTGIFIQPNNAGFMLSGNADTYNPYFNDYEAAPIVFHLSSTGSELSALAISSPTHILNVAVRTAMDANGGLYVATEGTTNYLFRVSPNGSLDTHFGTSQDNYGYPIGDHMNIDDGVWIEGMNVVPTVNGLSTSGDVLIAFSSFDAGYEVDAIKYNGSSIASLDSNFGSGNILGGGPGYFNYVPSYDSGNLPPGNQPNDFQQTESLGVQPDGKILINAGSQLLRFNANGKSIDTSFGEDGISYYNPGYTDPDYHIVTTLIQPDGNILAAANSTDLDGGNAADGGDLDMALFRFIGGNNAASQSGASPEVTNVVVDGTQWTNGSDGSVNYFSYLQSLNPANVGGYSIPTGTNQLMDLWWSNINQIKITFSENVNVPENALSVTDLDNDGVTFSFASFSYSSATDTATWTLTQPIGPENMQIVLNHNLVTDGSGEILDGAWTTGQSYPSGNGKQNQNFVFDFNVNPGDINQDAVVDSNDLQVVLDNFGNIATNGDSSSDYGDCVGNGVVDSDSLTVILDNFGNIVSQ
jgi:hypothetical protein